MVTRPLSKRFLRELERASPAIRKHLGLLEIADPRGLIGKKSDLARDTLVAGSRVRAMNVSRHSRVGSIIIKKVHFKPSKMSAREVLEDVNFRVRVLKQRFPNAAFDLRAPIAYAISSDLIAMAKSNHPNLRHVLIAMAKPSSEKTMKLKEKLPANALRTAKVLERHGFNEKKIADISTFLFKNKFFDDDVLVTGIRNGRLQLRALPEPFDISKPKEIDLLRELRKRKTRKGKH